MRIKLIKITSLIVLFLNLNVFAQSSEAPTLSAGLDNIAFKPGTLDVQLITEIIKEKQKELIAEGVKRFLIDNIIKADDFYTQFYLERIVSILFEEKNHQVMTKKILEETTNYLFILGTTEFVLNTKGKELLNFFSNEKTINENEKIKLNNISDKNKIIYLIYYICKDNEIVKKLGMLNNFNYFELNHSSKNLEFEAIRKTIDELFLLVNAIKNSQSLEGYVNNITLENYNAIKNTLSFFNINLSNTDFDNDINELFKNASDNKQKIKNKVKKLIQSINIITHYKKSDNFINDFGLDEYKAIKELLSVFNKNISGEDDTIITNFLNNPNSNSDKFKETLNKIISGEILNNKIFNKINNVLTVIRFIEELLNNHHALKDVINISGINKNNLTDKIISKYKKQVDEYDSINILPFTNEGKDYAEYFNFFTDEIKKFKEKINAYNTLKLGLLSWNELSELIKNDNINEDWIEYKNNINNALKIKVKFNDISDLITTINTKNNTINIDSSLLTKIQKTLDSLNEKNNNFIKIDALTSNKEIKNKFKNLFLLKDSFSNSLKFNYSDVISNDDLIKLREIISVSNDLKAPSFLTSNNIKLEIESKALLINTINKIKTLTVNEENKQEKITTLETLEKLKKFYEIRNNNLMFDEINFDSDENKIKEINVKIRLKKLFEKNKNSMAILNYYVNNFEEFYINNKENLTAFSTKIKNKIKVINAGLKTEINVKHDENLTVLFSETATQFDGLKDKIKVYFLGEDISQVFKIIRKELKEISIDYSELKDDDIKTLKKFNRIVLRRNLLDNISGLGLVKELNDELMSDLYFVKSSMTDSVKANKFGLILNTVEFAISNMIKKQVNDEKPFFREIESNINQYMDFIKFIGNIKELNKAETFSFLLKTMSNYKELFNLKNDNSLVDIVNSIRTYSIINNKDNVIEIDAASVLIHFTEKYINSDRGRWQFYATVGVNQSYMPNYKNAGLTSSSFSSASEKIGLKYNIIDFTKQNYKENKLIHQIKRKPFISNIYGMTYASGILYKIANTTDNGFESPNVGFALGTSFFNSLDLNFNISFPLEGQGFKNHFFGFSFDIPLSEYLSRL